MRRLRAACVQRRQMGLEGIEVAGSCGLKYGCGGGQAGQLGVHKLKVDYCERTLLWATEPLPRDVTWGK